MNLLQIQQSKVSSVGFMKRSCPSCNHLILLEFAPGITISVPLPVDCEKCLAKGKKTTICWFCKNVWKNSKEAQECGNDDCRSLDVKNKILSVCKLQTLDGIKDVPSIRACICCQTLAKAPKFSSIHKC